MCSQLAEEGCQSHRVTRGEYTAQEVLLPAILGVVWVHTGCSGSPASVCVEVSRGTSPVAVEPPTPASTQCDAPGTVSPKPPKKWKLLEDGTGLTNKLNIAPTKKPKKDRVKAMVPFEGMLADGPVIEFLCRFPYEVTSKESATNGQQRINCAHRDR